MSDMCFTIYLILRKTRTTLMFINQLLISPIPGKSRDIIHTWMVWVFEVEGCYLMDSQE